MEISARSAGDHAEISGCGPSGVHGTAKAGRPDPSDASIKKYKSSRTKNSEEKIEPFRSEIQSEERTQSPAGVDFM